MNHSFNTKIAEKYSINQAILLEHLWYWINKNKKNKKNYYDGKYWSYNSIKELHDSHTYLSEKQILSALKNLENSGLILTGNYNKTSFDRTKWYAFTEKGNSIMLESKIELSKKVNQNSDNGKPIPSTKPFKTHNKKPYGKYAHVYLSDSELDTHKSSYFDWETKIQNLDDYIEQTGKKYNNHFFTINKWENKNKGVDISGYGDTNQINYDE